MRVVFLFTLVALIVACAARGPIKVPDFKTFSFTGNAYSGDIPMPIQGALTKKGDELKFVLAARQGVVLGYGTIDTKTGKVDLLFSQSSGVKRLLKGIGEALLDLLEVLDTKQKSAKNWLIEPDGHMKFKSSRLELSGVMQGRP